MQDVWDFFRRFTDRYFDATFGKVPQAFLRFPAENEWAYNDGNVEIVGDQTDRDRITDKPVKEYPEVQKVRTHAEAHAKLGIFHVDAVLDESDSEVKRQQKKEAYTSLVDSAFDPIGGLRSPATVEGIPPDFAEYDDISADAIREELESDAELHAEAGVRYIGHEPWKQPLYDALLEELGEDLSELDEVDERPDLGDDSEDEEGEDGDGPDTVGRRQLTIEVTEPELDALQEVFGNIEADSPEERGEKVMELVEQIRSIRAPINDD